MSEVKVRLRRAGDRLNDPSAKRFYDESDEPTAPDGHAMKAVMDALREVMGAITVLNKRIETIERAALKAKEPDHDGPTFIWVHDCSHCTFLGTFDDHDLYHCNGHEGFRSPATVIARFGNEGPDYISGVPLAQTFKPTAAAIVRDRPIELPREARSAYALRVALLLALDLGLLERSDEKYIQELERTIDGD